MPKAKTAEDEQIAEGTRPVPEPAVVPDVQLVKIKLAATGDTVELGSSSAAGMVDGGYATYVAYDESDL